MEIVITTIFPPTEGAQSLVAGLAEHGGGNVWVIGDRKGPREYPLPGVQFHPIDGQADLGFEIAGRLGEGSYARKNLGYLLAIRAGADHLVETDDDNVPLAGFWTPRTIAPAARDVTRPGWHNVYRAFSAARVWPRGFPLEGLQESWGDAAHVSTGLTAAPAYIQQGLANENPDVDAVYRLTGELPLDFDEATPVRLGPGVWCPFNSQNTTFFREAFPLLYLPSHCSFRMTDIWRSFIAQRCLWAMDSALVFSGATVFQRRNEHSLLRDFHDEIPGYLQNERIRQILESLELQPGVEAGVVGTNLLACYAALVAAKILPEAEMALVTAWRDDLARVQASVTKTGSASAG